MIEKKLKTTHGSISVKMPAALDEVTLGQLLALQEKHPLDDLDAISILSGVPKQDLHDVKNFDDFEVFGNYVHALSGQIEQLYQNDIIPAKITFITGKQKTTVDVIRNLSVEPAGAFLAAREIIADEISEYIKSYGGDNWKERFQPSLKACCQVLAHYFFCRVTGKKYDEYEAEEFTEEIKKLRVPEALPIARHFFTCYPNLLKPRTGFFQRLLQFWRKKQASGSLRSLNISTL